MNKRVKELIKQATTVEEHKWGVIYDNFDKEKFVQLIVKECAAIADRERPNSVGCGYITKTKGMLIREHFGVEE